MATVLGQLETRFFAFTQGKSIRTVATGDLQSALGLEPSQERKLLSRLSRRGLIARVRRGLYLVPDRLPPGGIWSPGEYLALTTLMNDLNGRYQICGPNANYRYGWEDQVPNRIYAYNNRISGTRTVAKIQLNLIKVGDQRLGGVEKSQDTNGIEVVYSSKARALVDAVYDWSRFNTLPRAFGWILTELQKNKDLPSRLAELTVRYGNQGTARRMGMLLEKGGIQPPLLRKINRVLRPTTSLIPWVPTLPKRGQVNRRWGVIVNYDSE